MIDVYFSLGSNVGNKQTYLDKAIRMLKERVNNITVSSFYVTEPWGKTNQPEFLNICAKGKTNLSPKELLVFAKNIEASLGRQHIEKWGPREIDIDILFYGTKIVKTKDIEIPHPFIANRTFVLVPLAEIAPDFMHPLLKKSIKELSLALDDSGVRKVKADA